MVVSNLVGVHLGGNEVNLGHSFFGTSMMVTAVVGVTMVAGHAWTLWARNVW